MRALALAVLVALGCQRTLPVNPEPLAADTDPARALRDDLLADLERDERTTSRTIEAMRRVPRHLFAPNLALEKAYADSPQPIGFGQTISQPRIVAVMTDALGLTGREKVLEIGTGSGYQAAVLSLLAREVYTIEIVAELGEAARARLSALGYRNVHVRIGDGYAGWPEHAPFDRVIVTAAPEEVPPALVAQLAESGTLVMPIGPQGENQRLLRLRKRAGGVQREDLGAVRFVPMVPGADH